MKYIVLTCDFCGEEFQRLMLTENMLGQINTLETRYADFCCKECLDLYDSSKQFTLNRRF